MFAFFALVVFRIVSGTPTDLGFAFQKLNTSCCLTDLNVPDFDVQKFGKYNGSWWSTRYYNDTANPICGTITFKVDKNNTLTSETRSVLGNHRQFYKADPSTSGKFQLGNDPSDTFGPDVFFLGSDYATYTALYMGCMNSLDKCSITAVILTSEQEPDNSVYETAFEVADSYGLHESHFRSRNISDCGSHN